MSQVLTGSKASVKINGVKIGFASGINITQENTLTDIDVLDQLEVAEHAETGHKVNFSVNLFNIDDNSAIALGIEPSDIDAILSQPELTFELFDRIGERVVYEVSGVKFEGGNGSADARGVWQGTWNFKGRRGRGL